MPRRETPKSRNEVREPAFKTSLQLAQQVMSQPVDEATVVAIAIRVCTESLRKLEQKTERELQIFEKDMR